MPDLFDDNDDLAWLARHASDWVDSRLRDGAPLGRTADVDHVAGALGETITAEGLGVKEAFSRFERGVAPFTLGLDSPRFLAFIPAAPAPSAVWFDAVVGAATFSGEAWLEAAGAVHAENEALAFLARMAGLPTTAGGCFVTGGSAGNLSALAVARDRGHRPGRLVAVADTAHASVDNALRLLAMEPVVVPTGPDGRLTGAALEAVLAAHPHADQVATVVASAGSTNGGIIDDLAGVADVCERRSMWFHVDGAYGGGALLVPEMTERFAGLERADSFIVDPHKWLFSTLDCCALLYREPARARDVHTQHGPYIDVLHTGDDWNPSDLAFHLTRRTRGLPFWFTLAVHGTDAVGAAVRQAMVLARATAERFRAIPGVEVLAEPELSVVLFRRQGWDGPRWARWATELLDAGVAFVAPTTWKGEPVGRLVFLHPRTPEAIIEELAASLGDG